MIASWNSRDIIAGMTPSQRIEAVQKIVRGAIKLYRSPMKWIKGSWAGSHKRAAATPVPRGVKKADNYAHTSIESEDADCFCMVGALRKVGLELYGDTEVGFLVSEYLGDVIQQTNHTPKGGRADGTSSRLDVCTSWNDKQGRKFSDVMKMLHRSRDDFTPVFNHERGVIDARKA